jgi:hypothetical protein
MSRIVRLPAARGPSRTSAIAPRLARSAQVAAQPPAATSMAVVGGPRKPRPEGDVSRVVAVSHPFMRMCSEGVAAHGRCPRVPHGVHGHTTSGYSHTTPALCDARSRSRTQ